MSREGQPRSLPFTPLVVPSDYPTSSSSRRSSGDVAPPLPPLISPRTVAVLLPSRPAPPPRPPSYPSTSFSSSPPLPRSRPPPPLPPQGESSTSPAPSPSSLAHTPLPTSPLTPHHHREALQAALLRMGFSAAIAERAAEAGGRVERAVERAVQLVGEQEEVEVEEEAHRQEEGEEGEEMKEAEEGGEGVERSELPSAFPSPSRPDSPTPPPDDMPLTHAIAIDPSPPVPADHWTCLACTLVNPPSAQRCDVCRTRRSPAALPLPPSHPARPSPLPYPVSAPPARPSSPTPPPNCSICFEHVAASSLVSSPCGHSFCRTCWQGYLTAKVNDGQVLALHCPSPSCPRPLTSKEVLSLLPTPLHPKYDRFRTNAEIALDPNARWCPTPNCESVMIGGDGRGRKLKCSKCGGMVCFSCNERWHEGRSCEEAASSVMAAYKAAHDVKACPQCAATIERSEGCNHMTCTRCKHQFCWLCGQKYGKHHFAPWNLRGCPGLQDGSLSCIGNDRVLCFDCGCGCGCAGAVKRALFKLWVVFTMAVFAIVFTVPGAVLGLLCSPCLWWKWKRYKRDKAARAAARDAEREERRRRRRERALARGEIDESGRVLTAEERRARRAKLRKEREEAEARELEAAIKLSQMDSGDVQQPGGAHDADPYSEALGVANDQVVLVHV